MLGVAAAERKLAQETARVVAMEKERLAVMKMTEAQGRRSAYEASPAGQWARRREIASAIGKQGLRDWQGTFTGAGAHGGGGGHDHTFAHIGRRVGGIFGEAGRKVGESLGALSVTPQLAAFGLAAVGASMLLAAFGDAVNRAKEDVRNIGEIRQELRDGIREAFKSANEAAIGEAKSNRGAISSLIGSGKLEQGQALAQGLGPGGLRAAGTLNQARLLDNPNVTAAMRLAVGTGQITAEEFATTLKGNRGLASGSPEAIAKSVLARNGSTGVDVKAAGAAFAGSKFGAAFNALDRAEEFRGDKALGRFAAGGTEGGIREDAARIGDPASAVQADTKRKLDQQTEILAAIAANQGKMAALWDAIANRGDSATNTLQRNQRVTGEAVSP